MYIKIKVMWCSHERPNHAARKELVTGFLGLFEGDELNSKEEGIPKVVPNDGTCDDDDEDYEVVPGAQHLFQRKLSLFYQSSRDVIRIA